MTTPAAQPPLVPDEAVTAALTAAPDHQHISLGHWEPMCSWAAMRRILEAAAPLIAAAAREPCAGRIAELTQLAADMRATFHDTRQDGYRARAGQVQIRRWDTILQNPSATMTPAARITTPGSTT